MMKLPESPLDWIGPILGLISLITIAVGWGKWMERFNGLGKRVSAVDAELITKVKESEIAHSRMDAEARANAENIRIVIERQTDLIAKIGEQKRSSETAHDDTERLGIDLGSKIADLTHAIATLDKGVSNRLVAIETTLKLKPPEKNGP